MAIALDYYAGGTLKDYLADNVVPAVRKLRLATQVASAMAFVHQRRIAHLDLKTANVLLTDEGNAVLADFGISQVEDLSFATTVAGGVAIAAGGARLGGGTVARTGGAIEMGAMATAEAGPLALTPQYCAPERLLRKHLSFEDLLATDVYTLGTAVFVVWCGCW